MELPRDFVASKDWNSALSLRGKIDALPSTYAVLHETPFGRLIGTSRILYIGSTGKLGGSSQSCRLRMYNYPNGPHAHALRRRVQQILDSGAAVTLHWVHQPSKTDAAALESSLLRDYLAAHGELPPFNGRV